MCLFQFHSNSSAYIIPACLFKVSSVFPVLERKGEIEEESMFPTSNFLKRKRAGRGRS